MRFGRRPVAVGMLALAVVTLSACPSSRSGPEPQAGPPPAGAPPIWVTHATFAAGKICGLGVAGAGFDEYSPHPKRLSRERAVRNLAGILGTSVLEAIVDHTVNDTQNIELARAVQIDDAILQKIDALAETEYWIDREALGPFAQTNFTYANACVDADKIASSLKVDPARLGKNGKVRTVTPDRVPRWIKSKGKQSGGRLCAIGFSLPMFFADNTFEGVVEDIRGQLAQVVETLVSQYSEDITTNRSQTIELMTVASTQAIAKGVVVTDFWYDRDGRGPEQRPRSTYGWGCVYPVEILTQSVQAVEKKISDPKTIAKVREHAAHAFDDLDDEIAKRERPTATGTRHNTSDR